MNKSAGLNSDILTPQDYGRSLISLKDVVDFHYSVVGKNDPPYHAAMKKMNNDLLERWRTEMALGLSSQSGASIMIEAEKAAISLVVFLNGLDVLDLNKIHHFDSLTGTGYEQPEWIEKISLATMTEVRDFGPTGCELILQEIGRTIKLQKAYESFVSIYSLSNNPVDWYKLSQPYKKLILGSYLPWGLTEEKLKDVIEKLSCVLYVKIQPNK